MSGTSGVPEDAAVLRTQVASLRAANESLRALLEDKDAKIRELEAKLARLERLISRNSGNSSMPPSPGGSGHIPRRA
jgi:predicted RNase H-like nuclease (RuvC/YqgF family)